MLTPNKQTIFVYAPPQYGNATPGYAAYGENVTLPLIGLDPWDTLDAGQREMFLTKGLSNVRLRFLVPVGDVLVRVSTDVPATVVSTNGSLPLQLVFFVPMPIVGGDNLASASQARLCLHSCDCAL